MAKFSLQHLDISNNDFRNEADLIALVDMRFLRFLDLSGNKLLEGKK